MSAKRVRHAGAIQSSDADTSYTDVTGCTMDYDAASGYAQLTAKASGVGASLGLRLRAVLAGVLTVFLSLDPTSKALTLQGHSASSGSVGVGYFGALVPGEGSGIDPTTTSQFDIIKTQGVSPEVFLRFRQAGFNNAMGHQDTETGVGGFQAMTGLNGGITAYGLSTAAAAYRLVGCVTTTVTTDGATDDAALILQGSFGDGTALGDTANLAAIRNGPNAVALLKGSGQLALASGIFGVGSLTTPTNENSLETLAMVLATTQSYLSLATSRANADGQNIGTLSFDVTSNTTNYKNRARIVAQSSGATANKLGAKLLFYTSADNVIATTLAVTIDTDLSMKVAGAFGCNGASPQTAFASGGALAAYGAGANGYDSAAHAQEIHDMVGKIRTALVNSGIMS